MLRHPVVREPLRVTKIDAAKLGGREFAHHESLFAVPVFDADGQLDAIPVSEDDVRGPRATAASPKPADETALQPRGHRISHIAPGILTTPAVGQPPDADRPPREAAGKRDG
ncbi:MAG: hypothetical protein H0W90_08235 [Actinobacteria bacterium]|nr:hypothetical protein [Actinomycetota bacterium]